MKERLRAAAIIFFLAAADQITKKWALAFLKPGGPIPLIPDVLELLYTENTGAAFGILQNHQWLFFLIALAVVAAIFWMIPRVPGERRYLPLRLVIYFVEAGAVGNMIDRLFRHYVVDFIYFKLIDFPVFNVADIYVTCAAFALIFLMLFYYKDDELEKIFQRRDKRQN